MGRAVSNLLKILLVFALLLSLSSCSFFDTDMSALLSPPNPVGELKEVQKALTSYAEGSINLKHPSSGEHLSPIVLKDITGDGEDEALAFYSTETNGVMLMHLAFISKADDWKVRSDATLSAGGVDNLVFANLDDDKELEIIVGWGLLGNIEKQVAVYDLSDGVLVQRLLENYTQYVITDLNGDERNEVLIAYLSKANGTAAAKLFAIREGGLHELGNCSLDASASEYSTPIVTTLANGTPAIYIDATKDKGMITEVLFIKDGALTNGFFDAVTLENTASYRPEKIYCRDFDKDALLEIPLLSVVPTDGANNETVYLTRWCSFDGESLFSEKAILMNEVDGYSVAVPDRWQSADIAIIRNVDARLRTVIIKDPETEDVFELLKIRAVEPADWEKQKKDSQYEEIITTEKYVITTFIGSYVGAEAVTSAEVKDMIRNLEE